MILKLMYVGKQKLFQQYLINRSEQFIKDVIKNNGNIDYSKYVEYFKIDSDIPDIYNENLLRLLGELFIPELERRIPIRLFYVRLIRIFRIDEYPLIIKPISTKQPPAFMIDSSHLSLASLLKKQQKQHVNQQKRSRLIDNIYNYFHENTQYALMHYNESMKLYQSIKIIENVNDFRLPDFKMKELQDWLKYFEIFTKI